jgi:hypothetical protein
MVRRERNVHRHGANVIDRVRADRHPRCEEAPAVASALVIFELSKINAD